MTKAKTEKPAAAPKVPRPRKAITAAPPAPPPPTIKGKLGEVATLLRRPSGATIADMVAATGWQAHSVRGAMSGSLKKKLGLDVTSEKTGAGRVYRIASPAA